MPLELWPIVRLAEASDPRGLRSIRKLVERFVVSHLSDDPPELVALDDVVPPAKAEQGIRRFARIPAILSNIYRLELTDQEFEEVTDALCDYERVRITAETASVAAAATA